MVKRIFCLSVVLLFLSSVVTVYGASHKEYFEQGKKAYKNKQYTEALDNFRKAVSGKPGKAKYHYNLGLAARKLNRYREAYEALAKAKELDPGLGFTKKRGDFFKKLEEMKSRAGTAAGKAAAVTGSHKEFFEFGKKALKNKQYNAALINLRRAVAGNPGSAKYHYNLGLAARKMKNYREAYDAFVKAKELDPGIEFTNKRDDFYKKIKEMRNRAGSAPVERTPASTTAKKKKKSSGFRIGIFAVLAVIVLIIVGKVRGRKDRLVSDDSGQTMVQKGSRFMGGSKRFWGRPGRGRRDPGFDDARMYDDYSRDHGIHSCQIR